MPSSYLAYQYTTEWVRKSVDDELFKIDIQERESYNKLQTRLLNSSWRLMRQYKLPDEYRIVQDSVNDLFRAVNEPDSEKSLMMLRSLEKISEYIRLTGSIVRGRRRKQEILKRLRNVLMNSEKYGGRFCAMTLSCSKRQNIMFRKQ